MKNESTDLPWIAYGCSIYSAKVWSEGIMTGDRFIARTAPLDESMPENEDLDNAALIARAVNNHADLLAALKAVADEVRLYDDSPRSWSGDSYLPDKFKDIIRAAIAKATS